jgi:C-5 cytosine-specific DNA methylase
MSHGAAAVDVASTASLLARAERSEARALATPLTTVGLFSGIGGLELGLSRAGHRTVMLCENDRVARAVLDARFPQIPKHGDVTTLRDLPQETELVAAGFPCQLGRRFQ